jgi:hypothetical protein
MAGGKLRPHRGLYWAAVLVSLVVVVSGSVVAYLAYEETSGPDGAVKGYFAALARSDAAAALAFGDRPAGQPVLLTKTVLREQQRIAPIRGVQIVGVTKSGGVSEVSVSYQLGVGATAPTVNDTVAVRHQGRSWRLVRTAVSTTIELTQAVDRATIVGAAIPDYPVLMFPGALPISFDTTYLRIPVDTNSAVRFGSGQQIKPTVEVSPTGRTAVAAALTSTLTRCLDAHPDPRCPLPDGRYVPGSLRGSIPDLASAVKNGMTLAVDTARAGLIVVSGTVPYDGTYRKLNFNDVAATHRGALQIPLSSTAYAIAPIVLQWPAIT